MHARNGRSVDQSDIIDGGFLVLGGVQPIHQRLGMNKREKKETKERRRGRREKEAKEKGGELSSMLAL
jgi:hypothetical protein